MLTRTNPYHRNDIAFLSKHSRAVLTAIMLADPPAGAHILDAGCGWGLSSELMAFCGARVTAIDINPAFVELVRRRAQRFMLPITAIRSEFDTFETGERFDLLFFYECLHHSVKPWESLKSLGRFVKPEGKIVFAGEPVNTVWWPHWGLRLDAPSVYCARKFGWWESGWSMLFIARCFEQAGFTLNTFEEIGLDNGPIGIATRTGQEIVVNRSVREPFERMRHVYDAREEILRSELAGLQQSIADLKSSRSWKLTAPLRALISVFKTRTTS